MKQEYFLVISLVLLLTSCGGGYKKNALLPTNTQKNKKIFDQEIAKLDDIPFPWQAQLVANTTISIESAEQKRIKFYTQMSLPLVIDFYRQNMEFFGWKEDIPLDESNQEEGLLSFKKPMRWCIISIRPEQKKTLVVIFIGQMNESE
jgi:hypothetical protein